MNDAGRADRQLPLCLRLPLYSPLCPPAVDPQLLPEAGPEHDVPTASAAGILYFPMGQGITCGEKAELEALV